MTLFEFFTLLGGVGLFLYGMSLMSQCLKLAAGNKLRSILEHATANRFVAVAVGVLVTLLVQSSSATDMMVISFVNSGLMTLAQAIGVIMGANIGTTVTAQITAFNLSDYAPFILFIGAVLYLFVKKNTIKYTGSIILGFGMLFFGISVIKSAIVPLSKKVIPFRADESRSVEDRKLRYLVQTRGLPSSLAIQQAKLELIRMGGLARECLDTAICCFFTQNDRLAESVAEIEETIDILTDKIQEALISLRSNEYPPNDANRLSQLLLTASDIERISDYAENIAEIHDAKISVESEPGKGTCVTVQFIR